MEINNSKSESRENFILKPKVKRLSNRNRRAILGYYKKISMSNIFHMLGYSMRAFMSMNVIYSLFDYYRQHKDYGVIDSFEWKVTKEFFEDYRDYLKYFNKHMKSTIFYDYDSREEDGLLFNIENIEMLEKNFLIFYDDLVNDEIHKRILLREIYGLNSFTEEITIEKLEEVVQLGKIKL